jgi:hypothetical protein
MAREDGERGGLLLLRLLDRLVEALAGLLGRPLAGASTTLSIFSPAFWAGPFPHPTGVSAPSSVATVVLTTTSRSRPTGDRCLEGAFERAVRSGSAGPACPQRLH